MKKINTEMIKEKYNSGVSFVNSAVKKADDITVNPKIDASLTLKSKNSDSILFDCKFKFDKAFSLLKLIYAIIAVISAFVAASILVNALFSAFEKSVTIKQKRKIKYLRNVRMLPRRYPKLILKTVM